jgi:hypothetical protein
MEPQGCSGTGNVKAEVLRRLGRDIPDCVAVPWDGVAHLYAILGDEALDEWVGRLRLDIRLIEAVEGRTS